MIIRNIQKKKIRFIGRAIFFILMLGLVTGSLSLLGCEQATEPDFFDRQFIPVGNWAHEGNGYDIDNTTVWYYSPSYGPEYLASELKGDIVAAVDFSESSGVVIIKVTAATETNNTVGKYTGVYYKDHTSSHIFMANPIGSKELGYPPIEADTLNDALRIFTAGTMGTHVSMWGTYSK
jgi:hypothetical protein